MDELKSRKYKKNLLVLSSPSGGGKTTVARRLMELFPEVGFSVSATTRNKREGEIDGRDYHFFDETTFRAMIGRGEFVEYEIIFGNYYGTLHSETQQAIDNNRILLFDVDVKGALSLKKAYPEKTLTIFLAPPSMEILEKRLAGRRTETEEQVKIRMERVEMEMEMKDSFDYCIVNNELAKTLEEAERIFRDNILDNK